MEERRERIEDDVPSRDAVGRAGEPVCPRVEKRYPRRRAFLGGGLEVPDAPEDFRSPMPQRRAEHPAAGEENGRQVARGE